METVKVDIKKLQLLNDRISQCMEALNQVRLSTHGLSHTTLPQGQVPGYQTPQTPYGFGMTPYVQPFTQPFTPPFFPGLSHTTNYPIPNYPIPQMPFGIGPYPPFPPVFQGLSHTTLPLGLSQPPFIPGVTPPIPMPIPVNPFIGLSHTMPEPTEWYSRPLWSDPFLAARVAQTFPFVQAPVPPIMSIL